MEYKISRKLEKKFKDDNSLRKNYGELAKRIKLALSWIKMKQNLAEIPNTYPTRRHKLSGDLDGCWALDLNANYRMIVRPLDNETEPQLIEIIEIVDIKDYH